VKFFLDENLSPRVAEIARSRWELDVLTVHDIGAFAWSDEVQLRYAATGGRCLVTYDRDDFLALTIAAFQAQAPHAGVLIVSPSLPSNWFEAIAAALCDVAERFPQGIEPYTYDDLTTG
jgi:predicted nuclease of predicted toxin-antitoxin system